MQQINFRAPNPAQAGDRLSSIQTAVYLDEVNHQARRSVRRLSFDSFVHSVV